MKDLERISYFVVASLGAMLAWMILAVMLVQPARAAEETATLTIRVENMSPKGGMLRLGLYDAARYPDDDSVPVASADVPAGLGSTTITLKNVPPGVYAIQTFQDINSNNKMDTSWFGFPLEPFGFSRDAHPRLSKPAFDRVKFTVTAGDNSHTLHLQNSLSVIAQR